MPFFSVIIPTYNRYKSVKDSIQSVLDQAFRDFELIVVDDGSTDNTSDIEEMFGSSLLYLKQSNSGVSSARNAGIKKSSSPYIAFLDSDDIWLAGKLRKQYQFIKENPHVKIHQTEEIWIRNGRRVNSMNKHAKKCGRLFMRSLNMCMISPSSVVLHKSLFEEYGLFDENLPVCEDYDLWLRITGNERAGLIRENLIRKTGGHESQLSRTYWGMDRFRVYSIIKLLRSGMLHDKPRYLKKAKETALSKCEILLNGALKREKSEFAHYIEELIDYLECGDYSSIDCEILLKK
ncbi:MAG: glycosyltransferase [Spirochaetes bacterium]|nr:glycosyltransferase [Spirochaetota bacterium]